MNVSSRPWPTCPLYAMKQACERLRDGDFRESERQIVRGDEFGEMASTVAEMRKSISRRMHNTNDSAQQIAAASESLSQLAQGLQNSLSKFEY